MTRWPPAPSLSSTFYKGHGLGNDYLVFEEGDDWVAHQSAIIGVCDRHEGVGSDGIVVLLRERSDGLFYSRMFNPDGSEFERSGNGLRILASYVTRSGVDGFSFLVSVGGHAVRLTVHGQHGPVYDVSVEMGRADVGPLAVGLDPEVLDAGGRMAGPGGGLWAPVPISVGNPHLVFFVESPTEHLLHDAGPFFSAHSALEHGANVQLARRLDRQTIEALIWERGVGQTSASGTSACAVAVAAVSEGLVPPGEIMVVMAGGRLSVTVSNALDAVLRGPVEEVCTGALTAPKLDTLNSLQRERTT